MLNEDKIKESLTTDFFGRHLHLFETIDSTNDFMKECLSKGGDHGSVVCAEIQTAGRGRHARVWHSPPNLNLYFSLLLCPEGVPMARYPQLTMLAAISLYEAVAAEPEIKQCLDENKISLGLKWPNDLWLGGHKVSGILCENVCGEHSGIVIGIGLNVNAEMTDFPPELQGIATSLKMACEKTFCRETLLARFLNCFEADYRNWCNASQLTTELPHEMADFWNSHDILKGRHLTVEDRNYRVDGVADGIASNGFLRIILSDGNTKIVSAGDTHLIFLNP